LTSSLDQAFQPLLPLVPPNSLGLFCGHMGSLVPLEGGTAFPSPWLLVILQVSLPLQGEHGLSLFCAPRAPCFYFGKRTHWSSRIHLLKVLLPLILLENMDAWLFISGSGTLLMLKTKNVRWTYGWCHHSTYPLIAVFSWYVLWVLPFTYHF
jgi:hypothetical protein